MTPTSPDLDLTALMEIAERAKKQGGWFRRSDLTRPSALAFSVVDANYIEAWTPDIALAILTRLVAAEARAEKAEARVAVLEGALRNLLVLAMEEMPDADWHEIEDARQALASASGEGS